MADRADLYRAFAERFHAGKRLRPATAVQLAEAEAALGVLWPEAYRQFAMSCGAVYTPSLLDLVVEQEPGFGDVQQFLTPKQSVTETRRWHLEPGVAFACDCLGNFFAFRQLSATEPRPDDAAVWLFDRDADEVVQKSATFDEWLGGFLKL
jgi:hypothetical protein